MNFLKKFENILEQVDSQAAKQIEQLKSPSSSKEKEIENEEISYMNENAKNGEDIDALLSSLSLPSFGETESAFEIEGGKEGEKRRKGKAKKQPKKQPKKQTKKQTNQSPPPQSDDVITPSDDHSPIDQTVNENGDENGENDKGIEYNDRRDKNMKEKEEKENKEEEEEEEEEEEGEEERLEVENELLRSKLKAIEGKARALASQYTLLLSSHHSLSSQHSSLLSQREGKGKEMKRMMVQIGEYQKAIEGKDSLLASLQLKLQQKIDEVQLLQDHLSHSDLQLRQFHSAHKESEGTKRKIFEEIEEKNKEMAEELQREREENKRTREGMERRIKELEEQIAEFSGSLRESQELTAKLRGELNKAQGEIGRYEKELQMLRNELRVYKAKAASVLQQKDVEILSLSSPLSSSPILYGDNDDEKKMNDEKNGEREKMIERLEEDLQIAQSEAAELKIRIEELTQSLIEAEEYANEEKKELMETISSLSSSLSAEQSLSSSLSASLSARSLELNAARDLADLTEQRLRKQLDDTSSSLSRLLSRPSRLPSPSSSSSSLDDHLLDDRLHHHHVIIDERLQQMSDTIIAKQTLIDTLSSENAALLLQLQSLSSPSSSSSFYSSKPSKRADHHRPISADEYSPYGLHHEEEEAQWVGRTKGNPRMTSLLTLFPSLASSSSPFARPLLLFASFLDALSLRAASLLRLYPSLRLLSILYLTFLHLWLFSFVLSSSADIDALPDLPQ